MAKRSQAAHMAPSWLLLLIIYPAIAAAVNFRKCNETVYNLLTQNGAVPFDSNGTLDIEGFGDPIYHGALFGFHADRVARPLALTYHGCLKVCGVGPQVNKVESAFGILTTWVLPVIALLSSFPYESNDIRKNLEAFANWVGSPAAALTTTIWNLLMIRRCQRLAEKDVSTYRVTRDTLFILSCINQYRYERRGYKAKGRKMSTIDIDRPRDLALLRGVLFPFLDHPELAPGEPLRDKLENITFHLAFQLRLQRRRGVYPLTLSIGWFLLAFVISIVTAFAQLGDNTTAHSLALGLLLSWLPTLVVATVVDRNPVSAARCGILIERWLYNVDALFEEAHLSDRDNLRVQIPRAGSTERLIAPTDQAYLSPQSIIRKPVPRHPYDRIPAKEIDDDEERGSFQMSPLSPQASAAQSYRTSNTAANSVRDPSPRPPVPQWRSDSDMTSFQIQDYVGQGRRLRYCAVTDTVLDLLESPDFNLVLPGDDDAHEFKLRLTQRPFAWYVTWLVSQFLVTMSFAMAFLVSFNTPTIGLGCRSLAYLIWWSLSLISWMVIRVFQEPPKLARQLAWICDALAFAALFTLMGLQMTGGLNRCICKSSLFGSSKYGGYMDFQNAEFYQSAYDVRLIWGVATTFGLISSCTAITWLYHRWSRDSMLWKFNENDKIPILDGIDLDWLT